MKKTVLSIFGLFILFIGLQVTLTSSSGGRAFAANSGNTGAPGETTTCRSCHGTGFGATVSIVIKDAQGSTVTSYTPGAVYDAEFTVNATGASRYGFQMVSLDGSNSPVNGFATPAANTRLVTLGNGRQYAEHAGKSMTNTFTTQWTAPAAGTGSVTFYGGGAAVNNNGSTGGDGGNVTSINLTENTIVSIPCIADFIVIPTALSASFQDFSSTPPNAAVSYAWDFGDGNTSTQQNLVHFYANAGTYNACLVITDSLSNCTDSICKSVTVTAPVNSTPCVADFQTVITNFSTNFIDASSTPVGSLISYTWDFGDGNFSSMQNPTHTYANAGNYSVCLTISDANSVCTDSTCSTITISAPTPCTNSFTYTVSPNNSVQFSGVAAVSSGSISSYSWDFGDGTGTSTLQNPSYNYTNTGTYFVTFTATDMFGVSCSFSDSISVNTCSANFTHNVGSNGTVSFTNLSSPLNNSVSSDWDFGDGSPRVSTINPTHTYSTSGNYNVSLNIYDSIGNCSSSFTDIVNVTIGNPSSCNASFTKAKDSSVAYGVVLYNTSSNFGSHYYTWDFGDGIIGSGRTPIHTYQTFGSYQVCLTITDSILNCTTTFCDTVGMDSLGNLKTGFGIRVVDPTAVGINEINDLNSVALYPNPATHQLSLDLTSVKSSLNVRVMDVSGRIVMEQLNQNPGMIKTFDISSLESGLYFMVLNNGSSQEIKKFIKK